MTVNRNGVDQGAVSKRTVTAKGNLIVGTANSVVSNLAVGNDGETLVADSSTSTGLRYQGNFAAGKNKIINGDFNINQRSFTSTTTSGTYGFDRWKFGASGGTVTYSTQTFTAGNAPAAGYEGTNYARIVTSGQSAAGDYALFQQNIEDVHTLAGRTFTVSFWAKAASGTPKIGFELNQTVGTGGSGSSVTSVGNVTISTTWTRYSITGTLGSLTGVTPGTNNTSYLECLLWVSAGSTWNSRGGGIQAIQNNTFDIWGVQLEAGSVATAFQTATGTIQGELAACQRYYVRFNAGNAYGNVANSGYTASSTQVNAFFQFPVNLRTIPTAIDSSAISYLDVTGTGTTVSSPSSAASGVNYANVSWTTSSATAGRFCWFRDSAGAGTGYVGFSAEL